jgi:hypothetical protein
LGARYDTEDVLLKQILIGIRGINFIQSRVDRAADCKEHFFTRNPPLLEKLGRE